MFCPECLKQGLTSTLYTQNGGITTDMCVNTFYDENGKYHYHNPNVTSSEWHCSNGHHGVNSHYHKCPQGDYPIGNT